jgi:lipoate-protein ligase A
MAPCARPRLIDRARLIVTEALPGALNMALDEVLLAGLGAPVLRVYRWRPACVTLGYGQSAADVDFEGCARRGVDVTRRLTGGRAVLHAADELTYAVLVPADLLAVGRNVTAAYAKLCEGLLRALEILGITAEWSARHAGGPRDPACFAAAQGGDLAVGGRKLLGSAQCHRFGGILQHGSLPLTIDESLLADCLRRPAGAAVDWTCLSELGVTVDAAGFGAALAEGFEPLFGGRAEGEAPKDGECAAARALAAEKYGAAGWVRRL